MEYHTPEVMKEVLLKYPEFREKLYCRGFLLTNDRQQDLEKYPFYGNWSEERIGKTEYYIYVHKDTKAYIYETGNTQYFIVGHAYDPFNMVTEEQEVLRRLSEAHKLGNGAFWDEESNLTGVFCVGFIKNATVVYATDCAGMQLIYHGVIENKLYVTSHAKLVADLRGLKQTEYIQKLVSNRFWHYWGTFLPGDLSPYAELSRVVPNFCMSYRAGRTENTAVRIFPMEKVKEVTSANEYMEVIHELGRIMSNTMKCIAQKWPDKKVSISMTGGRDSKTTLACANGIYGQFSYFSYISNYDESVDAYAARDILANLGLPHELYEVPQTWEDAQELDAFKKVMECNHGCIGENNANDLRKRLYFIKNPPCDIEVKSWVSELGRGWHYNKYNKKKFPKYPYASYWRTIHKLYIGKELIMETDQVFADYLKKYYSKEVFDRLSWLECYYWEFSWSSSEGVFLTSEHRVSYDITIPFNNRKYVWLMYRVPIEKRKRDCIPIDLVAYKEPRIAEQGINIHDVSHTNLRALLLRAYLEIFSKIRYGRRKERY